MQLRANREDSYIGIWWWTGSEIIGTKIPTDSGYQDGQYIQPSPRIGDNHFSLWESIKQQATDKSEVQDKTFRQLERGRVIYDTSTMCFLITCSEDVAKNDKVLRAITSYYNLQPGSTDIMPNLHYHIYNPNSNAALESFFDNF